MTDERDTARIIGRWLGSDGDVLPDRVLQAALARIDRTDQRARAGSSARSRAWFINPRIAFLGAAIAAAVAVAIVSGSFPTAPTRPAIGAPGLSPGPTPAAVPATPTQTLGAMSPGTILFHRTNQSTGAHGAYTVSSTGQGLHQLVAGDVCCAIYSPDGSTAMVTVTSPNGRVSSAFVAPNGTDFQPITGFPAWALNVAGGAWGGPGPSIGYEVWDDANPSIHGIYLSSGGGVRRLTQGGPGTEGPIAFSPDGTHLLFIRVTDPGGTPATGDLYEIGTDGTGLRKLNPDRTTVTADFDNPASWSPDGSSIAFATFGGDRQGVYVVPATGGTPRLIVAGNMTTSARFSPDGRWVVFDRPVTSVRHGLYLVAPDGSSLHFLPTTADGVCCAEWSPDGRALVFESGPNGAVHLFTVLADGSRLTLLTPDAGDYGGYRWGSASR
jgi:hypothetical protein